MFNKDTSLFKIIALLVYLLQHLIDVYNWKAVFHVEGWSLGFHVQPLIPYPPVLYTLSATPSCITVTQQISEGCWTI